MRTAQRVLMREHLALRAVARVVAYEAELLLNRQPADLALLAAIRDYIVEFPDRIHHPKEEDELFRRMRARDAARCAPILDQLLAEHGAEATKIGEFDAALRRLQDGQAGAAEALGRIAAAYAAFLNHHIDLENGEAFPLAEKVLTEEDWEAIDAAFAANDDPLAGGAANARFDVLHRRILALAAPPPGL